MSNHIPPAARAAMLSALLIGAAAPHAQAALHQSSDGLSQPHETLSFEDQTLVMNQVVSNQFQSFGVTFSNAFGNPDPQEIYPNVSNNRIGNFQGGIGSQGTLVMDFANPLSSVAFALVTAPGTTTLQAYLNNLLVAEERIATDATNGSNYYGFEDLRLDRVALRVDSFDNALLIDNLQTIAAAGPAPVPEPAGWSLVGVALAGLLAARRRARA